MNNLSQLHAKWVQDTASYYDVFWIMQHYLKISWADLSTKQIAGFSKNSIKLLEDALESYQQGKPVAYIINHVEFYGLDLYVTEGVLIPRKDSEPMIREVIQSLRGDENILELGVGSGALACAIAYHVPGVKITAIDISEQACRVANINIKKLGLEDRVTVIQADWNDYVESGYDWVIANPPYIAEDDVNIHQSVKHYEPSEALFSEEYGYQDLFYIVEHKDRWLKRGGKLALEHGFAQQETLCQHIGLGKYQHINRGTDQQHPRYVVVTV